MPETSAKKVRQAQALLWVVPALWAVNYIVARKAPAIVGPYMLAFGRWGLAAMFLLAVSGRELWSERAYLSRAWWHYLVLGTLGMVICGAWVYHGARTTSTMNIALIYSISPMMIALGAVMWLGEGFGVRQGLGVLLALAGVLHVIVKGHWTALAGVQFSVGDLWILAATVAWAAYAILLKRWLSPLGSTARLAAICTGGTLVLVPCAAWEMMQPDALPLTHAAVVLMVIAAIVPGLGAYWIYGWMQKVLGASRVAVSLYLSPLYAGVAAWLMLGERPGWHHAFGALLILPGVFLVTAKPAAGPKPQPVSA
jgi:drug/metabolite transporter (DMT)-like permease